MGILAPIQVVGIARSDLKESFPVIINFKFESIVWLVTTKNTKVTKEEQRKLTIPIGAFRALRG